MRSSASTTTRRRKHYLPSRIRGAHAPEEEIRIAALRWWIDVVRSGGISPDQVGALGNSVRAEAPTSCLSGSCSSTRPPAAAAITSPMPVRRAVRTPSTRMSLSRPALRLRSNHRVPCNRSSSDAEDAAVVYEYDPSSPSAPQRGWLPDGFTVDIYGYAMSRWSGDPGVLEAVGIRTNLKWYGGQYDVVAQLLAAGELPPTWSWGSSSVYDASAVLNIHFEQGEVGEFTVGTSDTTMPPSARTRAVDLDEA